MKEFELLKTLKPHPHVIKLLGCCEDEGKMTFNAQLHDKTSTLNVAYKQEARRLRHSELV
jgi:uncharacterized lipoprotein YehR (DUF1307 family)